LLGELARLRLLVGGYRRLADLPNDLAASVRMRVGLPIATETVLAGPAVRDRWQVHGVRDEIEDQLTVRRAWLRGAGSGRPVLVLSFAVAGQSLPIDLLPGTEFDADVCLYPGGQPAPRPHRQAPTPARAHPRHRRRRRHRGQPAARTRRRWPATPGWTTGRCPRRGHPRA